uniref:CHCH domain-containing protein n=1 Tax=Parastrongyloides trichosuri TaxID=131310 RepID=A0A0N4Z8X0_PARTI
MLLILHTFLIIFLIILQLLILDNYLTKMVRRRSASPVSSGPVRRSSPAPAPARPAPAPQQTYSAPPAAPMASPMGGAAAPKQPGLMAQMAATAGGVAIGSSIGHVVGNMMTGGSGSSHDNAPQNSSTPVNQQQQQNYQNPCEFEYQRFFECSRNSADINTCSAYHDLFKECKTRNNLI